MLVSFVLCAQEKSLVFKSEKTICLGFFVPLTSQAAQHQAQLGICL